MNQPAADRATSQEAGTEEAGIPAAASGPYRVLVASRSFAKDDPELVQQMEGAGCVLLQNDLSRNFTEEELLTRIGDVDALVSGNEPVTEKVLAAAPRLKVIARHGVGYDNVDLEAARRRGIPVAISGDIADSVADLAMALLLAVARHLPQANASVRAGEWRRFLGSELKGKVLGIVGLGQIGKGVCRRARGFELEVVANDSRPDEAFAASWGVRYTSLDELLSISDFVTLHAPSSPETLSLIGAAQFARMKPTAYLINTARGDLVDEAALYDALTQHVIAGAAIDVFRREPPGDSPLLHLDNVIATPHYASQTHEGQRRMGEITAQNVLRVLHGQPPLYRAV